MPGILALDLATQLGWAFWPGPGGGKVLSGSHRITKPGASDPEFQGSYYGWLHEMLSVMQPAAVGYEAPLVQLRPGKGGQPTINIHTVERLHGLAGVTCAIAHARGIEKIEKVNVSTAKKHMTGNGKADKLTMIQYARIQGFDPVDDNEADAVAINLYCQHIWYRLPRMMGRTA